MKITVKTLQQKVFQVSSLCPSCIVAYSLSIRVLYLA